MKGIFDTKPNSGYDDEITRRYHFPANRKYLEVAHSTLGDWIIYREPQRNGGRRAYIAAARVVRIEPDPLLSNHAYAVIADYLPFDTPVPFSKSGDYWEAPLRTISDPNRIGQALQGKSLRPINDADFVAIIEAGLSQTLAPENAIRLGLSGFEAENVPYFSDALPGADQVRRVEQTLLNRKIRDASFRRQICDAYNDTCAVTGLRIVNGGGRSEVQAAHIWSVADGGPDVVQNGLALSGTVHWLFDRHLISLTNDYKLLVSHNKVPAELRGLFANQMERINLPGNRQLWPHPQYIAKHREKFVSPF